MSATPSKALGVTIRVDLWRFRPSSGLSPVTRKWALTSFGDRKQVIVGGIGSQIDLGQIFKDGGHVSKPVDKPSGKRRSDPLPNSLVAA